MAASRKLESKIIVLRIGFWSNRFSTKQWNLNLPPTLSQNQIAITVEDFNESVQAADVEAFITQERGPYQNCPIIICWHMWHI